MIGNLIDIIIRVELASLGLFIAYNIFRAAYDLAKLINKLNAAYNLRKRSDAFSVTAEILSFTEKRVSRLDTRYDVSVSYIVDEITYYTTIIIFNRGSLRVGRKMILLCDNSNSRNVILQNGEEESALRKIARNYIRNLIGLIICLVFDCLGIVYNWSGIVDIFTRAGYGAVVFLILAIITVRIRSRLYSK